MDKIIRQRLVAKGTLTRLETLIPTLPKGEPIVGVISDQLDRAHSDLEIYHEKIILKCDEEDIAGHQAIFEADCGRYETMKATLLSLGKEPEVAESTRSASTTPSEQSNHSAKPAPLTIAVPPLKLPVFHGKIEDWPSFVDLFEGPIHQNQGLNDAQKLHYLKGAVQGAAARLIRNLASTNENYDEAWNLLKNRYQHKRYIVFSQLSKLLNQKRATSEPGALRDLLDITDESIRSLKAMKENVDDWNSILVYILSEKLDDASRQAWELSLPDDEIPSLASLMKLLEQRARALDRPSEKFTFSQTHQGKKVEITKPQHFDTKTICPACRDNHMLYRCTSFANYALEKKWELIRRAKLCANCFMPNHPVEKCIKAGCRKSGCGQKHHTSLHKEQKQSTSLHMADNQEGKNQKEPSSALYSGFLANNQGSQRSGELPSEIALTTPAVNFLAENEIFDENGLLGTALVNVKTKDGNYITGRALIDNGSQINAVRENFFAKLQLPKQSSKKTITGLGGKSFAPAKGWSRITVQSKSNQEFKIQANAFIYPRITAMLPQEQLDREKWSHLDSIDLADPDFHIPAEIDLVLGVRAYGHIIIDGLRKGEPETPIAQNTELGWIVQGSVTVDSLEDQLLFHQASASEPPVGQILTKFWEIESCPNSEKIKLTPEEEACENHYKDTYKRLKNGRFQVKMPFLENPPALGESKQQAVQRLKSLERKFEKLPSFGEQYKEVIHDYIQKDHLEPVPRSALSLSTAVYLPHHGVIKESSSTTKLRVVFDAAARTSNGYSLNDVMMNGPTIQDDLFTTLIRFQSHKIALGADIEKMYRQVLIDPSERDYQRILWRDSPDQPIKEFRLKTVTFGVKAAPFLAIRTLNQLADEECLEYPIAAMVSKRDFYVDDLLTGAASIEEAISLKDELNAMLESGGFSLQKWVSNSEDVLRTIPNDKTEINLPLLINDDQSIKTLGLQWIPSLDQFSFKVELIPRELHTKRTLLSDASRVFDPLGWLSPVTVSSKILFQALWLDPLGWDDQLPPEIERKWPKHIEELPQIQNLRIPRSYVQNDAVATQLCGFSDASEKAYSAVVYARSENKDSSISIKIIAAKTRVAPLQMMTIPRLELNAALMLAELLHAIQQTLNVAETYAWTDSTVALHWISSNPSQWKTFVANRVSQIQQLIPPNNWRHVKGTQNPADCASRGITPSELNDHNLWWQGPAFLKASHFNETNAIDKTLLSHAITKEKRKIKPQANNLIVENQLIERSSSFRKLIRITAYCYRFIRNCREKSKNSQKRSRRLQRHRNGIQKSADPLSVEEIQTARTYWVRQAQAEIFHDDIQSLKQNRKLSKKSHLLNLSPYLDENGLLRVGGRLRHAKISHPEIRYFYQQSIK